MIVLNYVALIQDGSNTLIPVFT